MLLPEIDELLIRYGYLRRQGSDWLIVPENNVIADYDMVEIKRIWNALEPEDLPRFMSTPWRRSNEFRHRVLIHAAKLVLESGLPDIKDFLITRGVLLPHPEKAMEGWWMYVQEDVGTWHVPCKDSDIQMLRQIWNKHSIEDLPILATREIDCTSKAIMARVARMILEGT